MIFYYQETKGPLIIFMLKSDVVGKYFSQQQHTQTHVLTKRVHRPEYSYLLPLHVLYLNSFEANKEEGCL